MERLGPAGSVADARNPRLIWCAITGFGADGPYANIRAYDPVVQAASGIAATQAGAGRRAGAGAEPSGRQVTALHAAQAITAALFHRERAGEGQRIEVAMLDAALHFNWPEGMYNHPSSNRPPLPEYGTLTRLWPAADGHVSMAAIQDVEFAAMRAALGEPEALADPKYATMAGRFANLHTLLPAMAAEVAKRTRAALMAGFCAAGAWAATPTAERRFWRTRRCCTTERSTCGAAGGRPVRVVRLPARFSATPARIGGAAPA
jgi:crotonobetainyl-CoA:carnitine CoA-transferase CaiB-like acyl-CoA transferase